MTGAQVDGKFLCRQKFLIRTALKVDGTARGGKAA
jgi:hypothetical protein